MGAPVWSVVVVAAVLVAFTAVAVGGDAVLAARAAGRPVRIGTLAEPWQALPRLLVAQRRAMPAADALLCRLGVVTVPVAAVLAAVVVPFGHRVASSMDVGLVWFNAMGVLTWAGLWMAGWGANAVTGLVGGYRYVAQGLAYELPLMFALITVGIGARSLDVTRVVAVQQHGLWFAAWMPLAFAVYLAGVLAFSFLGPFDYPAGRELAGGVLAELGGPNRLLVQAGRWLLLTVGAGMAVPLFLGGGAGPLLPAWLWSTVKTLAVLALLVWVRRRLPTIRADRYVELAWVALIPLTVAQALAASLVVLFLGGAP